MVKIISGSLPGGKAGGPEMLGSNALELKAEGSTKTS